MSVAVCRSPAAPFNLEKEGFDGFNRERDSLLTATSAWLAQQTTTNNTAEEPVKEEEEEEVDQEEERPGQLDIWASIQSQKASAGGDLPAPYIHPLVRRSSSLLSQKSLEICTESLGSETGSDDFSSSDESTNFSSSFLFPKSQEQEEEEEEAEEDSIQEKKPTAPAPPPRHESKELAAVNYHCAVSISSSSSRRSPPRSFPPPLPSISRRDGPCLQMRPHRRDGRLVVKAVSVPSQNYLHAERQGGRLLLSFIDPTTTSHQPIEIPQQQQQQPQQEEIEEEEECELLPVPVGDEEEEEEVEVVDRGTVVEVKVSTQPQQQSGGAATMKVHRSSLVINKFVGGTSLANHNQWKEETKLMAELPLPTHTSIKAAAPPPPRRLTPTTTTAAAAAAVAATSLSSSSEEEEEGDCHDHCSESDDGRGVKAAAMWGRQKSSQSDNKLLFTSKRRNREELLHDMRRCSELRKPLFIWEACCIATSS